MRRDGVKQNKTKNETPTQVANEVYSACIVNFPHKIVTRTNSMDNSSWSLLRVSWMASAIRAVARADAPLTTSGPKRVRPEDTSVGSTTPTPTPTPSLIPTPTLTIASINVEMYRKLRNRPDLMAQEITRRLGHANADVICVQEDLVLVTRSPDGHRKVKQPLLHIPGYDLIVQCVGEKIKITSTGVYHLCNSTFVKSGVPWETPLPQQLWNIDDQFVPRCASMCSVRGVRIANVHLTGGRYDDVKAHVAEHVKSTQLQKLLEVDAPDVVVGDFNGSPHVSSETIGPYQETLPAEARDKFKAFFVGGHDLLRLNGFMAVAREDGSAYVTSIFGTSPDWMYYSPRVVQGVRGYLRKVDFTTPPHRASDHDALVATFLLARE